ncbi:uncharacterized protein LOC141850721 [Brevipalpus obovatus]|uniref:uncharacterized protein LOC141850721 n=1 Tax=Brevipalpus obovatus TaxID=246614 RepID=UPI003D9ECE51
MLSLQQMMLPIITLFGVQLCLFDDIQTTVIRDRMNSTAWTKMADCFRQNLGASSIHEEDIRCVGREMIAAFEEMELVACKNCQPYFDCLANLNAVTRCGSKSRTLEAITAIEGCKKTKGYEMDKPAGAFGRSGKDCSASYLCSANCNYHPDTKSCSRKNCRR